MSSPAHEWLTTEETAQLARTTVHALYTQRHRGIAPGKLGVKVGRRILWRKSDLDAWFDAQFKADAAK